MWSCKKKLWCITWIFSFVQIKERIRGLCCVNTNPVSLKLLFRLQLSVMKHLIRIIYFKNSYLKLLRSRSIIQRYSTASIVPSSLFYICTYWTVLRKERWIAATTLIQKCSKFQFWKVDGAFCMCCINMVLLAWVQRILVWFWSHSRKCSSPSEPDTDLWKSRSHSEELLQSIGSASSVESFVLEGMLKTLGNTEAQKWPQIHPFFLQLFLHNYATFCCKGRGKLKNQIIKLKWL